MEIRISKESEIPLRQQLVGQVVYQILTRRVEPGQTMPSVRELARRLKIHRNTVSEAYQELVRWKWLVGRRGSRLQVCGLDGTGRGSSAQDLDDVINTAIATAQKLGFSLQTLRERVRERLLAEPPDHILVVEQAPGLRQLLAGEIQGAARWPVKTCALTDLQGNPGLAIGALAVAAHYALADVNACLPKDRQAVPVTFSGAEENLERVRRLKHPSVVAVVSISQTFLRTARAVLAPALGARHTLAGFHLPLENPKDIAGADLVFCDSVAIRSVKHPHRIHYRLIAPESLDFLASTMRSYQEK